VTAIHKTLGSILLAVLFLAAVTSSFGQQSDNGSLTGTVTDQTGAILPNATVTVTNLDARSIKTVRTNDEGRWSVSPLRLGNYEVKVEAASFKTTTRQVAVGSGSTTLDVSVGIEEQENTVTVQLDQNSAVSTEQNPVTSNTITGRRVEELPAPTRSVFNFLSADSSVGGDLISAQGNSTGNPEPSINGQRTTSIGIIKDGVDATNLTGTGSLTENFSPAPETIQEVKVSTSLYDASLGRNGGGNIQVTTKSGGDKFAGTAYIYAQNEKFNANDFFFNRDGIDRQRSRRLEGGFAIGGPIIKSRLYFFGGYQKTDASTAYVATAQSLVVLPEALAFAANRSPEGLRQAFARSTGRIFDFPSCIATSRIPSSANTNNLQNFCIDPFGPGYKLFALRNPLTGDFLIPTLTPGRYQPIYLNRDNAAFGGSNLSLFDLDKLPAVDFSRESGIGGGNPLVRFRNVYPADFKQDQFTTRLDYDLLKGDSEGKNSNKLYGTFFFANFPATEPFSEDTIVSPFPLVRNDRNRSLALTDLHVFAPGFFNEVRFGYFFLNNTRSLDERLLQPQFTNQGLGISNPATLFNQGPETSRCGRVSGQGEIQDFQVCAPNDVFNRRKQTTLTFADNLTKQRGNHTFRFGVEHKRNNFDTDLPEEQAGDFENLRNFNELLLGYVGEADTSYGITDKSFQFNDLSFYFSDDWKFSKGLTLNLGVRWDWFGWPVEKNGRFANFDPSLLTNPDDPRPGFLLPSNSTTTGFNAIDASLPTITRAGNKHTLNGQDLNNFAPRIGFAWMPFKEGTTTIRGGYGIFYDRPSASFINTVYKNYPFFREIERKYDKSNPFAIQYDNAFAGDSPLTPFSQYLPFRVAVLNDVSSASPLALIDARFTNPTQRDTAEPLEFRAVDRDLKTPLIQQWNLGVQHEFTKGFAKGWTVEARYVGTRGQQLLLAVGFNQAYDLNDPSTPDYIFERLNEAYLRSPNSTNVPLKPGATARARGCGIAFGVTIQNPVLILIPGIPYPTGPACAGASAGLFDYNFDALANGPDVATDLIETDLRVPYLGLDPVESIMLQSRGYSFYHSGQLNVSRRFSKGLSFSASYTFSKSIDIGSTDPGSTASSGRPDTPNLGLVVQGDQRNLNSNRALSDFDRPHKFASSFVWELPFRKSKNKFLSGWQLSGFGQWQSGTPFSVLASNVEFRPSNQEGNFLGQFRGAFTLTELRRLLQGGTASINITRFNAGRASGTLFNAGFGRPNVTSLALLLSRSCPDITQCYFNIRQRPGDPNAALQAAYGRFGNLGRNVLRGPSQKRIDLSLQKTTKFKDGKFALELKWDVLNIFNFVNFANPKADLSDETDFGQITNTVGAPRVMQFGAKLRF
jgi:Carboxypeptidase regulatory-like domain